MSASTQFRRLLGVAFFTTVLLGAAVLNPLLVSRLFARQPQDKGDEMLACLFVPTYVDWPSHLLSYMPAAALAVSIMCGLYSLVKQGYRTSALTRSLLAFLDPPAREELLRLGVSHSIVGRVDVVRIDAPVAFCYGWIRPRICVSTGALAGLTAREASALLLHEYHHLVQRDPLKTALARTLASAFFFLPVVGALREQYMLAKELDADRYALRVQGSERPLLGALYKLLLKQPGVRRQAEFTAVVGAADSLTQRLAYLLDGQLPVGPRRATLFASSAIGMALAAVTAFTTWAALAGALWEQAHSGLGGC